MSTFRLDRSAFKAQTAGEAADHVSYYAKLSWQERLAVASYLNSIAYNYPLHDCLFRSCWGSYIAFVAHITEYGLPDFISFDHDLGLEESGYDCTKWLVDYCLDHQQQLPDFAVHSQNPVGKENIQRLLENFVKKVGFM